MLDAIWFEFTFLALKQENLAFHLIPVESLDSSGLLSFPFIVIVLLRNEEILGYCTKTSTCALKRLTLQQLTLKQLPSKTATSKTATSKKATSKMANPKIKATPTKTA